MTDFNKSKPKASKPVSKPAAKPTGKVKNISGRLLNLTKCQLKPGDVGVATPAECSTLSTYLEKV